MERDVVQTVPQRPRVRDGERVITMFQEGCRAFQVAFTKIMEKKLGDNPLGPILSVDKKLADAKLAEEADEHKSKGEARKEKRIAAQKGHKIPENDIDNKEKMLIKVATQGVVRLFNEVSKRQTRKGLNPSRSKDVKCMTFSFSMLFTSFIV
ncbi:uncharacterized protein LOC123405479 [Hordeum vulgare subsp. vulgare]|uniref:uncharacterized protein LOC123405479 n=1 Tax=Hordeum vulgare subsp. vulgare TaxID=112509 RepID=UPI001D1A40E5|nr:uncharacterized protein LOC123405479 [Hordeum vulgare subsp. vulgare]